MHMEKLRKQIRESFFNPVLHFLPLLIFLVVDEFLGISLAWKISFPVALILMIYIFFVYNRLFTWNLIFTIFFFVVSIIASVQLYLPIPDVIKGVGCEIVVLIFMLGSLSVRKRIEQQLLRFVPKLIPMTNNFNELNLFVWRLIFLMVVYVGGTIGFYYTFLANSPYNQLLRFSYIGLLMFLIVYEILRVLIIRSKLVREEWWPIINIQGKIVGSIQHLTSLNDEKKYMHPIVRVLLIDKGMILLQKRSSESMIFPGLWDAAISNHVQMGETIEQCVERTAEERYSLENFKYMYLSNYTLECVKENHYAFLFVSCQQMEYKLNVSDNTQLKWWTQQQIEQELDTGIFSDNFKLEYDLLQRSGLLETGKCECSCKLKDVIYQQSGIEQKE